MRSSITAILLAAIAMTACVGGTPSATIKPTLMATPEQTPTVWIRLKLTITDNATGQPVKATVKLDDKVVFENVDYCEMILPADTRDKGIIVTVEARGYLLWQQGYRYYWKTSKVYDFPVTLERQD